MLPRDVSILGLLMPTIVPIMALCIIAICFIDGILKRSKLYDYVAHPALVCIAIFVIMFCSISLFIY